MRNETEFLAEIYDRYDKNKCIRKRKYFKTAISLCLFLTVGIAMLPIFNQPRKSAESEEQPFINNAEYPCGNHTTSVEEIVSIAVQNGKGKTYYLSSKQDIFIFYSYFISRGCWFVPESLAHHTVEQAETLFTVEFQFYLKEPMRFYVSDVCNYDAVHYNTEAQKELNDLLEKLTN